MGGNGGGGSVEAASNMGLLKCFLAFPPTLGEKGKPPIFLSCNIQNGSKYQVLLMLNTQTLQDLSVTWHPFM